MDVYEYLVGVYRQLTSEDMARALETDPTLLQLVAPIVEALSRPVAYYLAHKAITTDDKDAN